MTVNAALGMFGCAPAPFPRSADRGKASRMNRSPPSEPDRPRAQRTRNPIAGGIFIALLPLAGAWFGGRQGQPVIGLLAGLGAGIVAALIVMLSDRLSRSR